MDASSDVARSPLSLSLSAGCTANSESLCHRARNRGRWVLFGVREKRKIEPIAHFLHGYPSSPSRATQRGTHRRERRAPENNETGGGESSTATKQRSQVCVFGGERDGEPTGAHGASCAFVRQGIKKCTCVQIQNQRYGRPTGQHRRLHAWRGFLSISLFLAFFRRRGCKPQQTHRHDRCAARMMRVAVHDSL